MVKRKALIKSLSSNLHSFLEKTNQNLSVPDKKFLRDGFIGLMRAGQQRLNNHCPALTLGAHSFALSFRHSARQMAGKYCGFPLTTYGNDTQKPPARQTDPPHKWRTSGG